MDDPRRGAEGPRGQAGPLSRSVRIAFAAVVVVATLTLGAVGLIAAENRRLGIEGEKAHDVLCAQRANDIARRDRAARLLEQQPGGLEDPVRYLGLEFPRSEVIRSREEAQSQINASESLDCDPLPAPTTTRPTDTITTEGMLYVP